MQHTPATAATTASSGHIVVERPPAGLARGRYAAAPWTIVTLGTVVIALTVAYAYWRLRKLRR